MSYLFRHLGAEQYGYLETALSVTLFGTVAAEMGLYLLGTREAVRDLAGTDDLVRRVASLQVAASAALAAAIAGAGALLPLDGDLRTLLAGFAVGLLGVPFTLHWVFLAQGRVASVAFTKAARYAVFLGIAAALVHGPGDVRWLVLAEIAGVAVMAAACVAIFRRTGGRLRLGGAGALDGALLRSALPIGGSSLLWVVRMYLSVVVVGAAAGPAAAGRFGAAHRIVLVGITLLDVYFTKMFPQMSAVTGASVEDLRHLLGRSMRLVFLPSAAAAVALQWLAPWALRIVYGPEGADEPLPQILAALAWLLPVIVARAHVRSALIALDRQRAEFACSVVGVAVLVAAIVPLSRSHGAVGAAWAMIGAETIAAVVAWALLVPAMRAEESARGSAAR